MKLAEALIAWTPASETTGPCAATAGTVKIGPLIKIGSRDWTDRFLYTGGAAFTDVRELTGADAVAKAFIDFHHMVVRDGIPPQAAHKAFLVIDEYASSLAPDVPGSTTGDDYA